MLPHPQSMQHRLREHLTKLRRVLLCACRSEGAVPLASFQNSMRPLKVSRQRMDLGSQWGHTKKSKSGRFDRFRTVLPLLNTNSLCQVGLHKDLSMDRGTPHAGVFLVSRRSRVLHTSSTTTIPNSQFHAHVRQHQLASQCYLPKFSGRKGWQTPRPHLTPQRTRHRFIHPISLEVPSRWPRLTRRTGHAKAHHAGVHNGKQSLQIATWRQVPNQFMHCGVHTEHQNAHIREDLRHKVTQPWVPISQASSAWKCMNCNEKSLATRSNQNWNTSSGTPNAYTSREQSIQDRRLLAKAVWNGFKLLPMTEIITHGIQM